MKSRRRASTKRSARPLAPPWEHWAGKYFHTTRRQRAGQVVPVSSLSGYITNEHTPSRSANAERLFLAGKTPPPLRLAPCRNGCCFHIEDGNHRLAVARRLGVPTLPVFFTEGACRNKPATLDDYRRRHR